MRFSEMAYEPSSASILKTPSPPLSSAFSSASASSVVTSAARPWPPSKPISMRIRSAICHQLGQDAMDGVGVDERYLQAEEPRPRLRVDQLDAGGREPLELAAQVVDAVGDVVHAGAAPGEEAADRRVVAERAEQLDAPRADAERCRLDTLLIDRRAVLDLAAEQLSVGTDRLVEIRDGDAHVVDLARRHSGDATATDRRCPRRGLSPVIGR